MRPDDSPSSLPPAGSFDHPPPREPPAPESAWIPPRSAATKFQHRYRTHILLFLLTLAHDAFRMRSAYRRGPGDDPCRFTLRCVRAGLLVFAAVLTILGAHEFGHYVYCRRHNVDATLPYFIAGAVVLAHRHARRGDPHPRSVSVEAGAVRHRRRRADRRLRRAACRFSTGAWRCRSPVAADAAGQRPLLRRAAALQAVERLQFGTLPDGHDVMLHPMAFAAWCGMLATALNLCRSASSTAGTSSTRCSATRLVCVGRHAGRGGRADVRVAELGAMMTIMMLVMAVFLGFRHPRVIDEEHAAQPAAAPGRGLRGNRYSCSASRRCRFRCWYR